MGVAIFLFSALVVTYALFQGQSLEKVSVGLDGASFDFNSPLAASKDLTQNKIEQSQSGIQARVRKLEAKAKAVPSGPAAPLANLNGTWTDANGLQYLIQQYGSEAVIQETSQYGITAAGSGTFQGSRFSFQFEAVDGSVGDGHLALVDSETLKGTFSNYSSGSVPVVLRR